MVKNLPSNAGDVRGSGLIHASGRFPGEGNGDQLQYLAWKTPETEKSGGLWSMGVSKSPTHLKNSTHKRKRMK